MQAHAHAQAMDTVQSASGDRTERASYLPHGLEVLVGKRGHRSKYAGSYSGTETRYKVGMGMGPMYRDTQRAGVGMGKLRHNDVRDIEA